MTRHSGRATGYTKSKLSALVRALEHRRVLTLYQHQENPPCPSFDDFIGSSENIQLQVGCIKSSSTTHTRVHPHTDRSHTTGTPNQHHKKTGTNIHRCSQHQRWVCIPPSTIKRLKTERCQMRLKTEVHRAPEAITGTMTLGRAGDGDGGARDSGEVDACECGVVSTRATRGDSKREDRQGRGERQDKKGEACTVLEGIHADLARRGEALLGKLEVVRRQPLELHSANGRIEAIKAPLGGGQQRHNEGGKGKYRDGAM
ncbi:hypothetical protein K438DRAFT_2097184 [Mycena galopus ATCC 62051]|nr:hypothetical protein K438DRAFT_2097184 [Mycena galopus ATCC 62051]